MLLKSKALCDNTRESEEVVGRTQTDVGDLGLTGCWVELEAIGRRVGKRGDGRVTYKLYFMNSSTSIMAASLPQR